MVFPELGKYGGGLNLRHIRIYCIINITASAGAQLYVVRPFFGQYQVISIKNFRQRKTPKAA